MIYINTFISVTGRLRYLADKTGAVRFDSGLANLQKSKSRYIAVLQSLDIISHHETAWLTFYPARLLPKPLFEENNHTGEIRHDSCEYINRYNYLLIY